jgi:hypothetical protein
MKDTHEEPKQNYIGVHLKHCYQGEYEDGCKYGDYDCPAKPQEEQESFNEKRGVTEVQLKDPNNCEHYKEFGCIKDICSCYILKDKEETIEDELWGNVFAKIRQYGLNYIVLGILKQNFNISKR